MGYLDDNKLQQDYFDTKIKEILEAGEKTDSSGNNSWSFSQDVEDAINDAFAPGASTTTDGQSTADPDQVYSYIEGENGYQDWYNETQGTVEDYFAAPVYPDDYDPPALAGKPTGEPSAYDASGIHDAHFDELHSVGAAAAGSYPGDEFDDEDVEAFERAVEANAGGLASELANLMLSRAKAKPDDLTSYDPNIEIETAGQQHNRLRWSEQCFLAAATKPLADLHRVYKRPYAYVDCVDGPPSEFLNRFFNQKNASNFVNIEPGQASELMPYFRLYKVLYQVEKDEETNQPTKISYHDEIPIVFENMAKEDLIDANRADGKTFVETSAGGNFKQRDDIPTQMFPEAPLTGYAWESFEWEFIGSNPATVRNDIKATLRLTFQDFNQLSKVRSASGLKDSGPFAYSLLDLLGYGQEQDSFVAATREAKGYEDQYRPEFFEIKAVVGWNSCNFRGEPKLAALASSTETQKIPLWLTLVDHHFDVSDIGVFSLTLNYRARMEALLTQPQACVLKSWETNTTLDQINNAILTAKKECDQEKVDTKMTELSRALEAARKEDVQDILSNLLHWSKDQSKFSDRLNVQRHDETSHSLTGLDYKFSTPGRIFGIEIPSDTLLDFATGVAEPIAIEKMISEAVGTSNPDSLAAFKGDDASGTNQVSNVGDLTEGSILDSLKEITPLYDPETDIVDVHFFYLGDLIEIAAHRALGRPKGSPDSNFSLELRNRIKVILGPYEFYNGATATMINLADMPISINSFVDFWYKNVVATRKRTYPLLDFVRDVTSQLVLAAMGSECFTYNGHPLGNTPSRLRTAFITLPKETGEDDTKLLVKDPLLSRSNPAAYDLVTGTIKLPFINVVEDVDLITGEQKGDFINANELQINGTLESQNHYLLLFAENLIPWDLEGDEEEDAKRGIHHLKIHKGILHSAQFRKTDAPYLRESRIQSNQYNPLVNLSNVYDVNLEMLGNTLFFPGTYVFLNPLGFGTSLGLPTRGGSVSNIMGLGGYHFIIKVTNIIDKSFTTSVVARWDNNGSGSPRSPFQPSDPAECEPPQGGE